MLRSSIAWPLVAAPCAILFFASARVRAETITLDQALERASHRPRVQLASLDVDVARAMVDAAALPVHNPELSISAGPQLGGAERSVALDVGVSQTFELGGKGSARREVAEADARVAEITRGSDVLVARVEAWRAFQLALVARDRLETRREVEELTESLVSAMQKSAALGGATQLRVNVLRAEAGRARQDRTEAEREYATELAALATAVGASASERLEPAGVLGDLPSEPTEVERVIAAALATHPEITIAVAEGRGARARVDAADAQGVPDLTIGIGYAYGQDPATPHAIVGTLSIPLPLRSRNQGARAAARIAVRRADLAAVEVRVEVERQARLAYDNYRRAREAIAGFDREVTGRLDENLALAQDAFAKGGIDFVELTITRRDLIGARLAYLDAQSAAIQAWAELSLATGGGVP